MASPATFSQFSSLPPEIRRMIWTLALSFPRLISFNNPTTDLTPHSNRYPQPPPLHSLQTVCHESKAILEATLTRMIHRDHPKHPFYINLHTDALPYHLLACYGNEPTPRITTLDSKEPRGGVRRVRCSSQIENLRSGILDFYDRIMTSHPDVEEMYFVITKPRRENVLITGRKRDTFLGVLKAKLEYDLDDELVADVRRRCEEKHVAVDGYVWKKPKILLDIGDLMTAGEERKERSGYDLDVIDSLELEFDDSIEWEQAWGW